MLNALAGLLVAVSMQPAWYTELAAEQDESEVALLEFIAADMGVDPWELIEEETGEPTPALRQRIASDPELMARIEALEEEDVIAELSGTEVQSLIDEKAAYLALAQRSGMTPRPDTLAMYDQRIAEARALAARAAGAAPPPASPSPAPPATPDQAEAAGAMLDSILREAERTGGQ